MSTTTVRPHEALAMKTPASLWHPSKRPYDANPPAWQYRKALRYGGWDLTDNSSEPTPLADRRPSWLASCVQLVRQEQRILVFYCQTLIRELDLAASRSTSIQICSKPRPQSQAEEKTDPKKNITPLRKEKTAATAALENATRFPLSLPSAAAKHGPPKTKPVNDVWRHSVNHVPKLDSFSRAIKGLRTTALAAEVRFSTHTGQRHLPPRLSYPQTIGNTYLRG